MEVRIFTLPFDGSLPGFDDEPLQRFCSNKAVHKVETQFFMERDLPYWTVLVVYDAVLDKETARVALDDTQRMLYEKLRIWRKAQAEQDGIPAYLICTNSQLQEAIVRKCHSLEQLRQIKGIGSTKIKKYGKAILDVIAHFYDPKPSSRETGKKEAASV